jgi:acyl-CoA thioester hydrolase
MKTFEKQIEIRWSDVDQNRHVRHSAYYDFGTHLRGRFLAEHGYDAESMNEMKVGPVLFKEECTFLKELKANDTVRVNILNGTDTDRPVKWKFHHEIFNQHGEKCAHVTVQGAWFDLERRRITRPPKEMLAVIQELPVGEDYPSE